MRYFLKLSFLNLWRQKKRTLISASAIAFSLWLSVLYIGVRERNHERLVDMGARLKMGVASIVPSDYTESRSLTRLISIPQDVLDRIKEQVPQGVERRLVTSAMATGARGSEGVKVLSFPDNSRFNIFEQSLIAGRKDSEGFYIGRALAERLSLKPGFRLSLTFTDAAGQIQAIKASIAGIFATGNPQADLFVVATSNQTWEKHLGISKDMTSYVALFSDSVSLPPLPQTQLVSWQQTQPQLHTYIKMDQILYRTLLIFIALIVTFNVFATMMMNLLERRKEVAVMAAMGLSPAGQVLLFLTESTLLSLVGLGLGIITILPMYIYLNRIGIDLSHLIGGKLEAGGVTIDFILQAKLEPEHWIWLGTGLAMMSFASGLYPSIRAAMIKPAVILREDT